MAESKRIFNRAKMNRDIDDRLLPEGEYRYALNVNIGESEGGDIGALENLKGNHQVGTTEGGTTIGVVRDPNNDRVYWFNRGAQFDTIYEYDESDGAVRTILKDSRSRDNVKPTCVPAFSTQVTDPASDDNVRPPNPSLPIPPMGGCTDSSAANFDPDASFDDGSCQMPPPLSAAVNPTAIISGSNVAQTGVTHTLRAGDSMAGTLAGGVADTISSFAWSDDDGGTGTGQTYDISSNTDGDTITVDLEITTASGRTATDSLTVTFQSAAPTFQTFTGTSSDSIADATSEGGLTTQGAVGVGESISYVSMVSPDDGFEWETVPTANTTGLPTGVTQGTPSSVEVGSTSTSSVTISGTWTAVSGEDPTPVTTWSGGTVRAIQQDISATLAFGGSSPALRQGNFTLNYTITGSGLVAPTGPTTGGLTLTGSINGSPITSVVVTDVSSAGVANPHISDFGAGTGWAATWSFQVFSDGWNGRSPFFNVGDRENITINSITASLTGPAGFVNPTITSFTTDGTTYTIPATYTSG